MKNVRDACQLQHKARSIKLSDQIEQLDELIHAAGDGSAFFEKTHTTNGVRDLITEGLARFAAELSIDCLNSGDQVRKRSPLHYLRRG